MGLSSRPKYVISIAGALLTDPSHLYPISYPGAEASLSPHSSWTVTLYPNVMSWEHLAWSLWELLLRPGFLFQDNFLCSCDLDTFFSPAFSLS